MYARAQYVPLQNYCSKTNLERNQWNSAYVGQPECTVDQVPSCVGDPKCRKPKDLFYSESKVLPLHRLDPMATKWGKGDRRNIINFGNGTGKSDYNSGYLKMDLNVRKGEKPGTGRAYGGPSGCVKPPTKDKYDTYQAVYDYNPADCQSFGAKGKKQEQCNRPFKMVSPKPKEGSGRASWTQPGCEGIEGEYATVDNLSCVRSAKDEDFSPVGNPNKKK